MELFSEIYSCYYQVLRHILSVQNACHFLSETGYCTGRFVSILAVT